MSVFLYSQLEFLFGAKLNETYFHNRSDNGKADYSSVQERHKTNLAQSHEANARTYRKTRSSLRATRIWVTMWIFIATLVKLHCWQHLTNVSYTWHCGILTLHFAAHTLTRKDYESVRQVSTYQNGTEVELSCIHLGLTILAAKPATHDALIT